MDTDVQGSTSTHSVDVALIRQCIALLTETPSKAFRPGQRRVPNLCLFCNRLFTSVEIRRHKSRCLFNPRNVAPIGADKSGRSKRLGPHELMEYLKQADNDGSSDGAD